MKKYKGQLQIGSLDTKKVEAPPTPPATPPPAEKEKVTPKAESGTVSAAPSQSVEEEEPLDSYGSLIPFADPSWYQSVSFFMPCRQPFSNIS